MQMRDFCSLFLWYVFLFYNTSEHIIIYNKYIDVYIQITISTNYNTITIDSHFE